MSWIRDIISPKTRSWESFYRNRWQHDKVVRSTHGVNCTGGCSWAIHVKDGIVTWELQQLDYPLLDRTRPPYEPRGCQRGISYSWYLYSPIRVKYPYVRGPLMDLWKKAKKQHGDPVAAWKSIQDDPEQRSRYQRARGKGGFRRASWDDVLEIIAASCIYTSQTYGSDRVVGFSPIPAMSQLSYAAGSRFLQLFGGVNLSFYDWYCDLPPASPEIWGEQTDVAESADWYHAKMIAVMGSNPNMTRTPDVHFLAEARHNGTKLVVFAPDFNQVAKYSDQWVALHKGQDGAFWQAVNHVILEEWHHKAQTKDFLEYVRRYTDSTHLVLLDEIDGGYRPGRMLRANALERYADAENGEWKFLGWDRTSGEARMLNGSVGHRWEDPKGRWNLEHKDGEDGTDIDPALTFLGDHDEVAQCEFEEFGTKKLAMRGVPAKRVRTKDGKTVLVATIYDLLFGQHGVGRGLPGEYPKSYDDEDAAYTPAWQEKFTGVGRDTVIQFAREWARTAEKTNGKCCVIIGAGINHWYHNNLMYRSAIVWMMLTGCIGKNGGGLNHYVGQEKLAPVAPWSTIAMAKDWVPTSRLQNAPSWHYMHCDQWRYEKHFTDYCAMPERADKWVGHTADLQAIAVRNGWLPFYPQFTESSQDALRKAQEAGCKTDAETVKHVVDRIKKRDIKLACEHIDDPKVWPRVWFIWRGNALMSSAKGHEYFLHHYLGTHSNFIAKERAEGEVEEIEWVKDAPKGKFDLIVDLNFRMDTSALYSDIVLPAASWYEKCDINSTDLHTYIHPLSEAVPPVWESKSDWEIFKAFSRKISEMAKTHAPKPIRDLVATPLSHDTAAEIAQPRLKDWVNDELEPVPGKTMFNLTIVERDLTKLYNKYITLGPAVKSKGLGAHGVHYDCADFYDQMVAERATVSFDGQTYPSLMHAEHAADAILFLAPETNGELAYRGYQKLEKKVGLKLTDLAEPTRGVRTTYKELQARPMRLLTSPVWSGLINDGRSYSAFTYNVDRHVPWRTLTGRQHFYLDHDAYVDFGEHLPTYKPTPRPPDYGDIRVTEQGAKTKMLNYLTPHGKWHIHSTYGDTLRMMTLSRGCEPFWMNDKDAEELGIEDNDWVEVHNDHGVLCVRCVVSARIPPGVCIVYHSPERTLNIPKSELRGRRAGGHNSLTRTRLKPLLMVGGYGQFTFHFNYWGPTGVNRDTHILVKKMDKVEF
ncbi:MAG: nitrate reductase subunit alpha [Sandaracinaceae bacterium]|nr:nitrate reductase subunit alpha [Sandaracinaceae bacterium]